MANSYKGNAAIIDTVSSTIDIANLMFGTTDAEVKINSVYFYNPTAADKFVLKDKSGNIVIEISGKTTGQDAGVEFGVPFKCFGLNLFLRIIR